MPLVQDEGKMRISVLRSTSKSDSLKKSVLKTNIGRAVLFLLVLSRQVVSAMSTDAEFLGNEKY